MPTNGSIAGVVLEGNTPVSAGTVRLYERSTGTLLLSQTTNQWGQFRFNGLDETQANNYFVVAFDPDGGVQYNAQVFDRLTAVTDMTRAVITSGMEGSVFGTDEVAFGSYDAYIKSLTPLAYWRFSETTGPTLVDAMGLANMTASGTFFYDQPSALFKTGDGGSIKHVDRYDQQHITTGKVTGLVPSASGFSVLFFAKLDTENFYQVMLSWRNYSPGDTVMTMFMMDNSALPATNDAGFVSWTGTPATSLSAKYIKDDHWHLVAVVYDAATNTKKMYVDNALVMSKTQGTPPTWPTAASVTLFNAADGALGYSSRSSLDEVAVFNYPLNEAQLSLAQARWMQTLRLYNAGANVVISPDGRTASSAAGSWQNAYVTHAKRSGRWYWETVIVASPSYGVVIPGAVKAYSNNNFWPGGIGNTAGVQALSGSTARIYADGYAHTAQSKSFTVGDVIGLMFDAELEALFFYINGIFFGYAQNLTLPIYAAIGAYSNGSATLRLNSEQFTMSPPADCAPYALPAYTAPTAAGWSPTDKDANWRVSSARRYAMQYASDVWGMVRGSVSRNTGVRYFEIAIKSYLVGATTISMVVGVASATHPLTKLGDTAAGWGYASNQFKRNNNTEVAYGAGYTAGDTIGVLVDFTAGSIEFFKNGVSQGIAFPSGVMGVLYPACSAYRKDYVELNLDAPNFVYPIPSGAVSWNS